MEKRSNICEKCFLPSLTSQKSALHPCDDLASGLNAFLASHLAMALQSIGTMSVGTKKPPAGTKGSTPSYPP
ncbi:hypothetical protein llap_17960 [Limosa lapponica baueri]|uniref:Uncharacterized protein n=1 Tax=Limosa lapponica baueri TaxID=1758121 RepID=A0A2I0TD88_LIMLA|nr:hypothetical protein llap_17960 [Limosa lapponica baueri]